jgi:hypothetical protein
MIRASCLLVVAVAVASPLLAEESPSTNYREMTFVEFAAAPPVSECTNFATELELGLRASLPGWLHGTAARETGRFNVASEAERFTVAVAQPSRGEHRNWIQRHPVLFGAAVGFGGGYLIGYSTGDDGLFDDFTAEFSGLVLGGIGAGAGALFGAVAGR